MNLSNKIISWCYFLLIVCASIEVIAQRTTCPELEWRCNNGKCIPSDELCDGNKDCADGSDETPESCLNIKCPEYVFRCAYGACVSGKAECNGVIDCADESDELSLKCPGVLEKYSVHGNCSEDSYQCSSGECIAIDKVCDGPIDCKDSSDETVKVCASQYCPSYGFHCGYGACIQGNAKCDGNIDCADGSDESPNLCKNDSSIDNKTTRRPIVDLITKPPFIMTERTTTKKTPTTDSDNARCLLDDLPNVEVSYESNQDIIRSNEYVDEFASIVYKCPMKYVLDGVKKNLCYRGEWINEHPTCSRYCSNIVISRVTIQASCEFNGTRIPCNQSLRPGTRATITCQIGYKKPDRIVQEILICGDQGEWDYHPFRCEQVCGTEETTGTPFVIGGEITNITKVPWHSGIYTNRRGTYEHICGGTIISAKIIISAAHCFWDVRTESTYDKALFSVAVGKYFRDFYAVEPLKAQFFNLSEIHLPNGYRDNLLAYQNDIAVLILNNFIEFKIYIKPICIEWLGYSERFIKSNIYGKIAGWGKIADDGQPSKELRSVDLPTIGYDECFKETPIEYRTLITGDKFCVGNENGETVCEGDSGGGFAVSKYIGGIKTYFLWGIVSVGLDSKGKCGGKFLTTFTNIQFHTPMIVEYETRYRPK